jgi:hypothetical protein
LFLGRVRNLGLTQIIVKGKSNGSGAENSNKSKGISVMDSLNPGINPG